MQKPKKIKKMLAWMSIVAIMTISMSCNRGYGCPSDASITTPAPSSQAC